MLQLVGCKGAQGRGTPPKMDSHGRVGVMVRVTVSGNVMVLGMFIIIIREWQLGGASMPSFR